jgi:hypothetical protein
MNEQRMVVVEWIHFWFGFDRQKCRMEQKGIKWPKEEYSFGIYLRIH